MIPKSDRSAAGRKRKWKFDHLEIHDRVPAESISHVMCAYSYGKKTNKKFVCRTLDGKKFIYRKK